MFSSFFGYDFSIVVSNFIVKVLLVKINYIATLTFIYFFIFVTIFSWNAAFLECSSPLFFSYYVLDFIIVNDFSTFWTIYSLFMYKFIFDVVGEAV